MALLPAAPVVVPCDRALSAAKDRLIKVRVRGGPFVQGSKHWFLRPLLIPIPGHENMVFDRKLAQCLFLRR